MSLTTTGVNRSGRVIVVGGGVIGAACAYYLAKAAWRVTIVDRGEFGKGCSHANCGFVCPSHVLPLAAPGAIGRTLQALLAKDSPFYIKPRFSPSLWSWLWRFARRCNLRDMLESAAAIQALLDSSRALYDQLIQEEQIDCEWEPRGLLFVFRESRAMEHYAETDRLLRDSFNVAAKRFDGEKVCELEPALKPGLAGGWLYERDAHLRPDRLMTEWRRVLEARGVSIREHSEVIGSRMKRSQVSRAFPYCRAEVTALLTREGDIPADAFVFATGAWTPLLNRQLGCKVPIQPGKGYSITMPRPARCPVLPLIFEEHHVAVTPMRTGDRLGSTMEFSGYDSSLNGRRLDLLKAGAGHYLHEPFCEPVIEEWYGWRPMTYDSKPIIDRSPAFDNVWIAAGHNMLGLSMAPATGMLIAELLSGRTPTLDVEPFTIRRFL